jgi:hypothetical protein
VPRKIASDDEMPRRRRRGAKAVAVEAEAERGFLMRIVLQNPKDVVAGALAFAAVSAIVANALFLQAGRHPAPMFGSSTPIPDAALTPGSPLPRPRPFEAETSLIESRPIEIRPAEKAAELKPSDSKPADPKSADPLANLVKATVAGPTAPSNVMRPPAPIPTVPHGDQITGSRRVAAVQRVLTAYGYGQLKATGTIGSDTQGAIQKFEREHKMPPTGQMSDRLVRELTAMVGHPID